MEPNLPPILNISSYLFVPLTDTQALRESIRSQAAARSLKGTVLIIGGLLAVLGTSEKAALFMAEAGVQNVLQLEGGILKYFEEAGGAHYEGGCFVFDEREAVASDLSAVRS